MSRHSEYSTLSRITHMYQLFGIRNFQICWIFLTCWLVVFWFRNTTKANKVNRNLRFAAIASTAVVPITWFSACEMTSLSNDDVMGMLEVGDSRSTTHDNSGMVLCGDGRQPASPSENIAADEISLPSQLRHSYSFHQPNRRYSYMYWIWTRTVTDTPGTESLLTSFQCIPMTDCVVLHELFHY